MAEIFGQDSRLAMCLIIFGFLVSRSYHFSCADCRAIFHQSLKLARFITLARVLVQDFLNICSVAFCLAHNNS